MSEERAVQAAAPQAVEDLETLRAAVGPELTNSQLKLALLYAQKVGADLFRRDIYPVVVDNRLTFITSIDFARSQAQASGEYRGQGRVEYGEDCDCAGEEVKLERRHPMWAEVPVHREGFIEAVSRRAYFHEYAPLERSRDGAGWVIKFTWRKMPHVMVAKVSEMLAIRVAFPKQIAGLYVAEEMEQAGVTTIEGEVVGQQRLGAGDIEPDPDAPDGLPFMGSVYKAPDGVRNVKRPDWAAKLHPDEERIDVAELAFRVGRSRHTAKITGPLAHQVVSLAIQPDEMVATDGKLVQIEWQQGKPKKKELHGVTRVAVMRQGAWVEAGAEAPVEEEPEPAATIAQELPGATQTPADPFEDESAYPEPAAADADELGAALSGTVLEPKEESAPAPPAPADVSQAMKLSVWQNEDGKGIDAEAVIIDIRTDKTSGGTPFLHGWVKDANAPLRFEVVMAEDEAQAQGAYDMAQGQLVRIVGTWTKAASRGVVMVTALVAA